jgi:hypothetical protein
MDPVQFGTSMNPMLQPTSSIMFAPGIVNKVFSADDYLASLDSDTRDYVLKHTDESRTKEDIEDCIYRLHHSRKIE